jgi:hypothetical protein
VLGEVWSLSIDGVTFILAALLLARLPALRPPRGAKTAGASESTGFVDGLRYVARTPVAAALISVKSMMAMAAGGILVIPLFGDGLFAAERGPAYIGLLYTARGIGAIIGAMLLRTVVGDSPRTLRRMILLGFLLTGIGYVLLGASTAFWWAALALAIASVGTAGNWVYSGTLVQIYGDPAYHGRLFSLEFGLMTLMFSVVSWFAGLALDDWGLAARDVATWSGVIMVLPILIWAAVLIGFRRERQRRLDNLRVRDRPLTVTDTFELPAVRVERSAGDDTTG